MNLKFSNSLLNTQECFVQNLNNFPNYSNLISFARGEPNELTFPLKEILDSTIKLLSNNNLKVLQYSNSEGEEMLRSYIADRYKANGINVSRDNILITTGAQQGFNLLCQIFISDLASAFLERPCYLGAVQTLNLYNASICSIPLTKNGLDIEYLKLKLNLLKPVFIYSVTNFNNPTGITYSLENKEQISSILKNTDTLFIEDDPYGELRFEGQPVPSMKKLLNDHTVLLGSFSKIIAPAMRVGWICASKEIIDKLIIAKQAMDIHTSSFVQSILLKYLSQYDLDSHILKIRTLYKHKRDLMLHALDKYFSKDVSFNVPEGGMFLWLKLPKDYSSTELFNIAYKNKVIFVPGETFYSEHPEHNTLRLNFTSPSDEQIVLGIKNLAKSLTELKKLKKH